MCPICVILICKVYSGLCSGYDADSGRALALRRIDVTSSLL